MFGYMTFESVVTALLVVLVIQLFQINRILTSKLDVMNTQLHELKTLPNKDL